jgi:hypothetical protein
MASPEVEFRDLYHRCRSCLFRRVVGIPRFIEGNLGLTGLGSTCTYDHLTHQRRKSPLGNHTHVLSGPHLPH